MRRLLGLARARLDQRSLGGQVVVNSGWLLAERVARMVLAFAVTVWVIRYLGDEDYGVLAYALSLIMLVEVIATFGMRSVVVRELVNDPDREPEIIGTTLGVKVGAGILAASLIVGFAWMTARGSEVLPVLTVLAVSLPLHALTALDLTFQAYLQSQHAVVARTLGLLAASLVRIVMLLLGAPLLAFAIASAIEMAATGVAIAVMYQVKRGHLFDLRFRLRLARRLVGMSWPFFMSALAAGVYLRIDQVMLHAMTSSSEVGQYAAAARLSEVWYFIPVALATSLLPMFVIRRREGPRAYRRSLQRSYDVAAWLAICLAVGVTVVAGPVVGLLYGPTFDRTADILRVHIWAAPFLFLGTVMGRAVIAEDMRKFEFGRHAGGALINVGLNFLLIPGMGGLGAALATVASYAFASYFACLFYPRARLHLRLMTLAFLWPFRLFRSRPSAGGGAPPSPPPEDPPRIEAPEAPEDGRAHGRPARSRAQLAAGRAGRRRS